MVVENKGMLYQHFLLNFTRKSYQTQGSFKVRALVEDEKKVMCDDFLPYLFLSQNGVKIVTFQMV